ncbi:unnamed protein product [Lupinus luteus]|uniref:Uncharacterized protein n=1 Tax=Lupinus luteus TaxID=3873 RepID=A0AAV1WU54_LUPLU
MGKRQTIKSGNNYVIQHGRDAEFQVQNLEKVDQNPIARDSEQVQLYGALRFQHS